MAGDGAPGGEGRRPHRSTCLVLAVGLAVSAVASGVAHRVASDNERRLLVEDTRITATEAGSLATQARTTVASTLAVLSATNANPTAFKRAVANQGSFLTSWVVERDGPRGWQPVLTVAAPPSRLATLSGALKEVQRAKAATFLVLGLVGTGQQRVLARRGERLGGRPSGLRRVAATRV